MTRKILYSIRTNHPRVGDLRDGVTPAYLRLYDGFVSAWIGLGYEPIEIIRPEIIPSQADRLRAFGRPDPLHIIFKSPENIRILKGARNIGCFALETPGLRDRVVDSRPFSNEVRMLKLLDEVWVGSETSARILTDAGVPHVRAISCPSPVTEAPAERGLPVTGVAWFAGGSAVQPALRAAVLPLRGSAGRVVFAASLDDDTDMGDPDTIIDAFLEMPRSADSMLLILCGSSAAFERLRTTVTARQMAASRSAVDAGPLIGLVSPTMGWHERAALYACSHFYVCTCRFDADKTALLEAMGQGCIPVAVRHSAMGEVLGADDPFPVAADALSNGLFQADRASCTQAMTAACSLSDDAREKRSSSALRLAQEHRSPAPLARRLQALTSEYHV